MHNNDSGPSIKINQDDMLLLSSLESANEMGKALILSKMAGAAFIKEGVCVICNQSNQPLFECDGCYDGYHSECYGESINDDPNETWICKKCTSLQAIENVKASEVNWKFPLSTLEKLSRSVVFNNLDYEDASNAIKSRLKITIMVLISKAKCMQFEDSLEANMFNKWNVVLANEPGDTLKIYY